MMRVLSLVTLILALLAAPLAADAQPAAKKPPTACFPNPLHGEVGLHA
jgi:hypothetical protein